MLVKNHRFHEESILCHLPFAIPNAAPQWRRRGHLRYQVSGPARAPSHREEKLAPWLPAWQAIPRTNQHMKIAIGSDHAGFEYKDKIREFLEGLDLSGLD